MTYGTGAFLLANVGTAPVASRNRLLTTVLWQLGPGGPVAYALEGSVFVAGAAVQWLRDGLHAFESTADVERLAATVEDTGGVVVVPAFTGLGAPYWDPDARGAVLGITRGTGLAEIARATLEGIAQQVADVVEAMAADMGSPLRALRVDGGAAANDGLMQFQADLLGPAGGTAGRPRDDRARGRLSRRARRRVLARHGRAGGELGPRPPLLAGDGGVAARGAPPDLGPRGGGGPRLGRGVAWGGRLDPRATFEFGARQGFGERVCSASPNVAARAATAYA